MFKLTPSDIECDIVAKQGITNMLALPIDKMLYIYLLCPHSKHQKNLLAIRAKPKYVLNADIFKCFNCIKHEALLNKLKTLPSNLNNLNISPQKPVHLM
jgi:hypothetical protein